MIISRVTGACTYNRFHCAIGIKAEYFLTQCALLDSYHAFIFPYFINCNHICGATDTSNRQGYVILQNKIVRIISHVKPICKPLHDKLGIMKFERINSLRPSDAYMRQYTYHYWFRWWLVAWSAPSHYLNQCWNTVNWTLGTNFSEILIEIHTFSFKKINFKMSSGN